MTLTAFAINCSLKSSSDPSSTDKLLGEILAALTTHGVSTTGTVRIADLDVRAGVSSDEGDGDEWPAVRQQILDADIFVLGTPIWMGHPSSHAQRVLERLDAFLGETDAEGRMVSLDRVAVVAVVGNEDGGGQRRPPGCTIGELAVPGLKLVNAIIEKTDVQPAR